MIRSVNRPVHVLSGGPRSEMPFRHVLLLPAPRDRRAGAAGGGILNAELAHAKGYLR